MKKIVILTEHHYKSFFGGSEYQISLLTKALANHGYKIYYVYINYSRHKYKNPVDMNACLYPLQSKTLSRKFGKNFFLYGNEITCLLKNINPDLIYHRSLSSFAGIAARYCAISKCKLVWHIASESDLQPFQLSKARTTIFDFIDKKYAEYGIKHADYIVGQARYQDRILISNYGVKCDSIIGNWQPIPTEDRDKDLPYKILWVANIKQQKHPEIFVELAKRFIGCKDVEFIMIGRPSSGKYQQQLNEQISEVDNLTYLGEKTIAEVNKVLDQSHILVNTSEHEGFSNTFVQAWMRGLPVVSLAVDPDDILKIEKIGFHSGNLENLFCDTEKLINSQALLSVMGKKARKFAKENYSLKKNIGKMIDLIESVLK